MSTDVQWLQEQRVPGGTSFASSMLRTQADTGKYVEYIVNIVADNKDLPLTLQETMHGYEVTVGEQIIWFGREIDVELLRATSANALEEYLCKRVERLEDLKMVKEESAEV